MNKQTRGNIMLLITAFIWGSAFVAQRTGMDYVGPYTFSMVRFLIATITMLPIIAIFSPKGEKNVYTDKKALIQGGILCGIILFIGQTLQQVGLQYTDAGKTGFITALYVVLVPILGSLFFKQKVSKLVWFCALLAMVGLYLLTVTGNLFDIAYGDFLIFICSFAFAFHILVIGKYSPRTDAVKISAIQFFVVAVLSFIMMMIFETPVLSDIMLAMPSILYAAVLSAGVGFTFQMIAQKDTNPTIASLILCLESVFAVLSGAVLLNETLTGKEILGCVIMFVAITLAQKPDKNKDEVKKAN